MKKIGKCFWMAVLTASLLLQSLPVTAQAAQDKPVLISETTESRIVSDGLIYEKKLKLTHLGWVDLHVLKMDLENPNVGLKILRSGENWGERTTLSQLLLDAEGIAGINGSFFNMTEATSDSVGVEYSDGRYSYVKDNTNTTAYGPASLVVDEDNTVMMPFVSGDIQLENTEGDSLYVSAINGFSDFANPVILNRAAMADTALLDADHALYKIVVENERVTQVVAPGETARVPEKGYIVLVDEAQKNYIANFSVGTRMRLQVGTNLADKAYKLILSGGGQILQAGELVQTGTVIEPENRHPRSAVGVTGDGKTLITLVVDGRGESIGATHEELAGYLLEYGVTDAIHLDGGGSSTLAARSLGTQDVRIENIPSDGTQRSIINGLGFIQTVETGALKTLVLEPGAVRGFADIPVTYRAVGYDAHYNPVELDEEALVFAAANLPGSWKKNVFTPTASGIGRITCYYGDVSATATLTVSAGYTDLDLSPRILHLDPGETGQFELLGTDEAGVQSPIALNGNQWTVEDDALGSIQAGLFTAGEKTGTTKVVMTMGNQMLEAYVVVGGQSEQLTGFEDTAISALTFPKTAQGMVSITEEKAYEGSKSMKLEFKLPVSDVTQAVYGMLDEIYFEDPGSERLGLYVSGDGKGAMLKARIVDAEGNPFMVTLTDALGLGEWQYLEASLPAGLNFPVKLERIYVVALKTTEAMEGVVYIDKVMTKKAYDASALIFQPDLPAQDDLQMKNPEAYGFSAAVFGPTLGSGRLLDRLLLNKVTKVVSGMPVVLFAGARSGAIKASASTLVWDNAYASNGFDDVKFISLATGDGGLIDTDYTQWERLKNELKSTAQNNIVLIGDRSPVDPDGFQDLREGLLLHSILRDYRTLTGKTIYYINAGGHAFNINNIEGIRYIDLNGLNYHEVDGKVDLSASFNLLKFYMVKGTLYYDYEQIYPLVEIQ